MNNRMNPRDRYYAEMRAAEERRAEAARRAAEENRRRELLEQKRRYNEKMERRRRHEAMMRKKKRRAYAGRVLLFVVCFLIIFTVVMLCVFVSFHMKPIELPDNDSYDVYFGEGDGRLETEVARAKLDRGGVRYVDYTKLAEYLSLTVVGGSGTYRFVIPGTEEETVFTDGSPEAYVNGEVYRMKGNAAVESGKVWVPLSFVSECMTGVNVTEDDEKMTITFLSSGSVGFTMKRAETLGPIPDGSTPVTDEPPVSDDPPEPEFTSDLSAFEQYMNPADRDAYLILVNSTHKIDRDYAPDDLVDIVNTRADGRKEVMRECAEKALEALFIELYANGYDAKGPSGYPVSVMSAYRSYDKQEYLFNIYTQNEMHDNPALTREEAEAITATYSARPGTSEHQTGLCVDMHNLPAADQKFASQEAYEWLRDNAWKFGFILRFPEDKEEITGITFEPWHYRFVGRYHAYKIWKAGMCLEEYVESLGGQA